MSFIKKIIYFLAMFTFVFSVNAQETIGKVGKEKLGNTSDLLFLNLDFKIEFKSKMGMSFITWMKTKVVAYYV